MLYLIRRRHGDGGVGALLCTEWGLGVVVGGVVVGHVCVVMGWSYSIKIRKVVAEF